MESPNRAKKFIFFIILLVILGGAGYYAYTLGILPDFFRKKESPVEQSVQEQVSVFEPVAEPILMPPTHIFITERNISADIIEVGLQTDGTLDTPKKWNEAGWYKKGAKPGEDGNVIINAHFDDNFGRPAAFWQLKNATVGDTVLLEDSLGRQYAYQIVDSLLVDINDPDRLKVLEDTDGKSELTLITCGGVWLPGKSTYDKRLVVKAELIDSL
ncbi:hypothetical protein A2380_02355 [candidate division WWE3 bacterium RIFOXYB1_FULL_43_24]|nr:MAG: Peptidase C60 sortase A and B [candidate division WWE3 bacterium GW2011_GWA1_42_12]KKS39742.1 MAG: Peptidase C60 sortase A and B [candidate division WWE3 bacterium GW2011_GWE1_42_16]OGC58939.1 MAG: hypothetical protein A2212_03690 [candidate division WWE3 bacterium RIFOXYA1_FULL_42_9]OGC68777.1 MAG: hypothetical protein A2380_02355 [candidate division WWE3 bacterium RIFOXYB1_FULL_43_24]OGC72056.1 MAG: hypothetical protein A2414_03815 [candidate division WWE3 bacterium RIFOXYC1_FULL_42_1